jgi:hypothetical protein
MTISRAIIVGVFATTVVIASGAALSGCAENNPSGRSSAKSAGDTWAETLTEMQVEELSQQGFEITDIGTTSYDPTSTPEEAAKAATSNFSFTSIDHVSAVTLADVTIPDARIAHQTMWVVLLEDVDQPAFGPPGTDPDGGPASMAVVLTPDDLDARRAVSY